MLVLVVKQYGEYIEIVVDHVGVIMSPVHRSFVDHFQQDNATYYNCGWLIQGMQQYVFCLRMPSIIVKYHCPWSDFRYSEKEYSNHGCTENQNGRIACCHISMCAEFELKLGRIHAKKTRGSPREIHFPHGKQTPTLSCKYTLIHFIWFVCFGVAIISLHSFSFFNIYKYLTGYTEGLLLLASRFWIPFSLSFIGWQIWIYMLIQNCYLTYVWRWDSGYVFKAFWNVPVPVGK